MKITKAKKRFNKWLLKEWGWLDGYEVPLPPSIFKASNSEHRRVYASEKNRIADLKLALSCAVSEKTLRGIRYYKNAHRHGYWSWLQLKNYQRFKKGLK